MEQYAPRRLHAQMLVHFRVGQRVLNELPHLLQNCLNPTHVAVSGSRPLYYEALGAFCISCTMYAPPTI